MGKSFCSRFKKKNNYAENGVIEAFLGPKLTLFNFFRNLSISFSVKLYLIDINEWVKVTALDF